MKCNKVKIKISACLDNELTAAENTELMSHVNSCMLCKKELEDMRYAVEVVKKYDMVKANADFISKINMKVEQWENKRKMRDLFFYLKPVTLGISLTFIFIISTIIGNYYSNILWSDNIDNSDSEIKNVLGLTVIENAQAESYSGIYNGLITENVK